MAASSVCFGAGSNADNQHFSLERKHRKKLIIAVEVSRNPKDFNCKSCWHRNCDAARKVPGSNGAAPFARWKIEGVIESNECLLPMVTDLSRTLIKLEKHYRDGHLPFQGGLLEQPNLFLEAMHIF